MPAWTGSDTWLTCRPKTAAAVAASPIAARGVASKLAVGGRRLTGPLGGGDLLGGVAAWGGQGGEGAGLGLAQAVLLELETFADAVVGDRGGGALIRREQHDRDHAELRRAQAGGVFLDEGVQLGVGRGRHLAGHGRGQFEPAAVAGLEGRTGEQGAVDARHAGAGEDGGAEMLGRILVAQVLLQHGRGQVLLGQGALIGLLVELAGDRVEEGRDLADLLDDQILAGTYARLPGPVQEAQLFGLAVQEAGVDVLSDQVLVGHGTTGLLLDILAHATEGRAELGLVHRPVASVDDVFRSQVGEYIHARAHDHETDGDQDEQGGGPLGAREGAEGGDHSKTRSLADVGVTVAYSRGRRGPARTA
jgi:hypothetical protein